MSNLPIQFIDKENSPALLAIMQQFGEHTYVDAELINKFRDAINEIHSSLSPDRIISLGTETIDGNEHTYEDYTWQLGGVQVNNIGNPSVIVIPSATVGFKRKDISVFTPAGTIERVAGTETDGEVVTSPDVPEGTLYYKSYDIDGDTIEVDTEPPAIDGAIYKKKIENTRWKSMQSGANVVIPFQAAGYSHYSVVHSGLISVAGFTTAALTSPMYEGQDVLFENQTGNPITLKDSFGGVNTPFDLGADLVVPNEGKIWFRSRNGLLELIMKSWSQSGNLLYKLPAPTPPATGTTSNLNLFSHMFPANTFKEGDYIDIIDFDIEHQGNTGRWSFLFYFTNDAADDARVYGDGFIKGFALASHLKGYKVRRGINVEGGKFIGNFFENAELSDYANRSIDKFTRTIDITKPIYMNVATAIEYPSDSIILKNLVINKY